MKKLLFFFFLFLCPLKAQAYSLDRNSYLYISGETIGIKLYTNIEVLGTFDIDGKKPWDNKIKEGDIILKVDGKNVSNILEMKQSLKEQNVLTIQRKNKTLDVSVNSIKNGEEYSLGIYLRDNVLGVGTMTYIVPETKEFGSLGHSMNDIGNTGEIYSSTVTDIHKSRNGNVGEKNVEIDYSSIGIVKDNTETGVYGYYEENINLPMYQIGKKEDVHAGSASILTTMDGEKVEEYQVNIREVYKQNSKSTKSMKIEITDERLLDKAGGIVQGMSGSPIIQDGKIIGALTHVVINDTKCGYGIYIEWMLEEMGINLE